MKLSAIRKIKLQPIALRPLALLRLVVPERQKPSDEPLVSREDIQRYIAELRQLNERVRAATGWTIARQALLLLLAILAFLQYIFMDALAQIAAMPSIWTVVSGS